MCRVMWGRVSQFFDFVSSPNQGRVQGGFKREVRVGSTGGWDHQHSSPVGEVGQGREGKTILPSRGWVGVKKQIFINCDTFVRSCGHLTSPFPRTFPPKW